MSQTAVAAVVETNTSVTNATTTTSPTNADAVLMTASDPATTSAERLTQRQMLQVKVQSSVENKSVKNTLHHALGPFLVLSRFFGILPVTGVWPSEDVKQVQFKWITLPMLATTVSIAFATTDFLLTFKMMSEQGLKLTTTGPLSFSIECLSAYIVFLCFSRNWPNLIKSTRHLENVFSHPIYTCEDSRKFNQRIRLIGWSFLVVSLLEHSFYVTSGIYSNYLQIRECNLTMDFWHNYYVRERSQIFSLVDYKVWLIPLVQWVTIAMTFTWNFVDIFLILISTGLAARFRQFHWCIKCHLKKNMSNDFWSKIRQDFLVLNDLFGQYDDKLSILVLLSSAQNLYFLAVQMFHSFLYHGNFMNDLYFWISLSFVAFRCYYMMSTASSIHDSANEIRSSMYEIPTAHWCLELKRLNEVIVSDMFALSGRGFFFLTKRLMFAMAGTLVVYELVLLDQIDSADVTTPLCNQLKGKYMANIMAHMDAKMAAHRQNINMNSLHEYKSCAKCCSYQVDGWWRREFHSDHRKQHYLQNLCKKNVIPRGSQSLFFNLQGGKKRNCLDEPDVAEEEKEDE